jgi:hypothetical protein
MNQTQHLTTSNTHLQTWVSREFKQYFARVAKAQGLVQASASASVSNLASDKFTKTFSMTQTRSGSNPQRLFSSARVHSLCLRKYLKFCASR